MKKNPYPNKSLTQKTKKMKKTEVNTEQKKVTKIVGTPKIGSRGRIFEGVVIKKLHKRVTIEFERMVFVKKYERYKKSKTKIHARLPDGMKDTINIGDYIRVRECRPLSKILHFIVVEKIKSAEEDK